MPSTTIPQRILCHFLPRPRSGGESLARVDPTDGVGGAAGSRKAKVTLTLTCAIVDTTPPPTGQRRLSTLSHPNPRQMAQGVSEKQPRSEEGCCADFNKDIQEKRHKRRSKPQPWILLKFTVFLTFGIIGFATYVYVDRFCVPMLTRKPEAMGDRVFGSEPRFWKCGH